MKISNLIKAAFGRFNNEPEKRSPAQIKKTSVALNRFSTNLEDLLYKNVKYNHVGKIQEGKITSIRKENRPNEKILMFGIGNGTWIEFDDILEVLDVFEITDVKNMSREEAEKIIRQHYHDKLTYKGHEFFDSVYMNKINIFAQKQLRIGKSVESSYNDHETIQGQESYLGYLPKADVFVSGWDIWELSDGDDISNVAFIKIDQNLNLSDVSNRFNFESYGMMYPENLKRLHAKFVNLIDIRLD